MTLVLVIDLTLFYKRVRLNKVVLGVLDDVGFGNRPYTFL